MNIVVGDNETGKTTLLEAVNLVLSSQIDGRYISYELDPYLFNANMVANYFASLRQDIISPSPYILIEAYLNDDGSSELTRLKGSNNSENLDCPGLYLRVELDEDFAGDFLTYCKSPENPDILPTEYYTIAWRSFADNSVTTRELPFRSKIIDTSVSRGRLGPNKYLSTIISDVLEDKQRIALSIAYRKLKSSFMDEPGIKDINAHLEAKKGDISQKKLAVSMDIYARSTWDSGITAHLDDLPFRNVGKGEQCRVQMKLAIESAGETNVLLIEEPENHLSHSNMSGLIKEITTRGSDRQIILSTHSNFVLNKLGINNVKLLSLTGDTMTLLDLSQETQDYFMKLPGHDTLRVLLSLRAILVEGPSDELIVQKAYELQFGKLPLEDGIDVISVNSLAFSRFLEIGKLLNLNLTVVTDNDGDVEAIKTKYNDFINGDYPSISICFDTDEQYPSLEQQMLKHNSLDILNFVLGKSFANDDELLSYMKRNKTDCALEIFNSDRPISFPDYISDAIKNK